MGCCGSAEAQSVTMETRMLLSARYTSVVDSCRKIVLLGSSNSGKSTLFKQLCATHGDGFSATDIAQYKAHIHSQVITQMLCLVNALELLQQNEAEEFGQLELTDEGMEMAELIKEDYGGDLNEEVAMAVKLLWTEPALKAVFEARGRLNIADSSAFFWDKVEDLAKTGYSPSHDDIVMAKHRTEGVASVEQFEVSDTIYRILDIGGQKKERRRMHDCFEGATAVIFMVSLSSYCEVLFEDGSINAMDDSFDLFAETVNLRCFEKTPFFLLLNKKDVFEECIKKKPLTFWDSAFDGDVTDYEQCVSHITRRFEGGIRTPGKTVTTHTITTTDEYNVESVFTAVRIALNYALASQ